MTIRDILWQLWTDSGLEHLQLRRAPIVAGSAASRYKSVSIVFTHDLPVDRDGLVVNYPRLLRRVTIMP